MARLLLTIAAAVSLGAAVGCKNGTQLVQNCTADADCGENHRCGVAGPSQGLCLCSNDNACPQDGGAPSTCNPDGFCQLRVGCTSNADCDPQSRCDTTLGECVTGSGCSSDLDCPIGQVCDKASTTCVPGCHSNGDCPLGEPCVCSSGRECGCPPPDSGVTDPALYDRSQCEVGACRNDTCADDSDLCPYNDDCVPGADGGLSTCQPDNRMAVLCQNCVLGAGASGNLCSQQASQGANFCLIDPHGSNLFCGVDCSRGQNCPSGYECDDVIILTQNLCSGDQGCVTSNITCSLDTDGGPSGCPPDSPCVGTGSQGHCGSYCAVSEGNSQGFCTCVTDSDCPRDSCDQGFCRISQQPCVVGPSGDAFCASFVSCVDLQGVRGCFIGRNCAPTHGLHCPIQQQQ